MKKILYLWGIIVFGFLSFCCTNKQTSEKYTTITTFIQENNNPKHIALAVKLDSNANVLQEIDYGENGITRYVLRNYYDSLKHKIFATTTYFSENAEKPYSVIDHFYYNTKGLLEKKISISYSEKYPDTTTVIYDYYPNKNLLRQQNAISKIYSNGLTKYYYNEKDSLIKITRMELNEKRECSTDSIVYENSKKIEYGYEADTIQINMETFFKDNKIVKQIDYRFDYFSKTTSINRILTYEYENNRLVKMIEKFTDFTEWCGVEHSKARYTYTYIYE